MRISTNTIFDAGSSRISEMQASLARAQQQISTGRRILTPSDDPVGAARALDITQSQSVNAQYAFNRQNAQDSLNAEEGTLSSVTGLLQNAKVLTVNAGNGTLTDKDRGYLATQLQSNFDELLGYANAKDATGNYLFSGYQTASQPFTQVAGGVQYQGDQGQRLLQVDSSRQMAMSDSGTAIFENVRTGNGTFTTGAAPANTGSGVVSAGSVVNPAALNGHNYNVTFTVTAGVTTYDIVDATLGTSVPPAGNAYVSGQAISLNGMQFNVSGAPANGDAFSVQPSSNQSVFKTLNDLITLLKTPVANAAGQAVLTAGLATANGSLDKSLDNVSTVRASIGSRLKEIDSLDNSGSDKDLQYTQTLSKLQDLDYAKAISDLTQQQFTLDAAQKSFVKTSGLSLFNFM